MVTVTCPLCWKKIDVVDGLMKQHVDTISLTCRMSNKHPPACVLREAELEDAADKVVRLAADLRDDLATFHAELDVADKSQLREWLAIALAAIDTEKSKTELFSWVTELDYMGAA